MSGGEMFKGKALEAEKDK